MQFEEFKRRLDRQWGLNLNGYKERQLKRRIDSLMLALNVGDYETYYRLLQQDPEQKRRFLDKVTINVSEFFRNPEIFAVLEREILPPLLRQFGRLKVWSAACSIGAEPYSLAILLDELAPGRAHRVEATDIDEGALEQARQGVYDANCLKNVSPQRLARYFEQAGKGYRVKEQLRRMVFFRRHDLLTESYPGGYHLIVCRNVTIYFTAEVQRRMYQQFRQAVVPGGVLFIGATESILQYRELGWEKISPWFYRKATEREQ